MRDWYVLELVEAGVIVFDCTLIYISTAESIRASAIHAARPHLQRPGQVAVELVQKL